MSLFKARVERAARELITTPSDRDQQVDIGPSDMADPCQKCLASKLAGVKPHREFSMYPWLGTAIHRLLEWTSDAVRFRHRPGVNDMAWELFGDGKAIFELRVHIGTIEGYGDISGSVDVVLPEERGIIDWKSSSKKKIKVYKLKGVPDSYRGQIQLYLDGLRKAGYYVEKAVLVFIPRDAHTPADIWLHEESYDPAIVEAIYRRLDQLMLWVKAGRWQELPSDSDCFICHPFFTG